MANLATLTKISRIESPVVRIARSILDDRDHTAKLLEPITRQAEMMRSLTDSWAPELNAARQAREWFASSLASVIPPGFDETLRASRSIRTLSDCIQPGVFDYVRRSSSACANMDLLQPHTTRLAIESLMPEAGIFGRYMAEIARILENVRFPQVDFGGSAMRAFIEREDVFHSIAQPFGFADIEESEEEPTEEAEPQARREPEAIPNVVVRPFPAALLRDLRIDPAGLHSLTPEQFELLIADRLDHMGFDPVLTGGTNRSDGGIDIVAVPRKVHAFGCLIAVQCEHHCGMRKTGRRKGRDLLEWKGSQFQLGVLVTNTTFTQDVRFAAHQPHNRGFLRLREFADVVRWIQDNYDAALEWSDIPEVIELVPGIPLRLRSCQRATPSA